MEASHAIFDACERDEQDTVDADELVEALVHSAPHDARAENVEVYLRRCLGAVKDEHGRVTRDEFAGFMQQQAQQTAHASFRWVPAHGACRTPADPFFSLFLFVSCGAPPRTLHPGRRRVLGCACRRGRTVSFVSLTSTHSAPPGSGDPAEKSL